MKITTFRSTALVLAGLFLLVPMTNNAQAQSDKGGLALSLKISSPGAATTSATAADLSQLSIQSALSQGIISADVPSTSDVTVIESQATLTAKSQLRHIQLSPDQIIVTLTDQNGQEIYKTAETDPRLLRVEAPGDDGEMTMQEFYYADAVLDVVVPQIEGAQYLEVLKPSWDGSQFTLERLVQIDISTL